MRKTTRSTGAKTRSPGRRPGDPSGRGSRSPNTPARYLPTGMASPPTIRPRAASAATLGTERRAITARPLEPLGPEQGGDQVAAQQHGDHEADRVLGAHRASSSGPMTWSQNLTRPTAR